MVDRAELQVPAQRAAQSCQELYSGCAPSPIPESGQPLQEDARPESPPKCYPVQEPAQQLLNTPLVQSQQKSCPHVRYLPRAFVSFSPDPWRPPVPHCAAPGPWTVYPRRASSQLESLLAVTVVRIFQLLQDPIQNRRPLFLRGLCGRWRKGEKTPRGFGSESGRQRCVGRARGESKWGMRQAGINHGGEQTQLWSVQPQLGLSCLPWMPVTCLPPLPQNKGPTLGSQWPT